MRNSERDFVSVFGSFVAGLHFMTARAAVGRDGRDGRDMKDSPEGRSGAERRYARIVGRFFVRPTGEVRMMLLGGRVPRVEVKAEMEEAACGRRAAF